MLGLIIKDFLLIKSNLKTLMIIFFVFFVMMIKGIFDPTFIIPFIGIMLFISTFSYDDFNHWNSYAVSLPNGRKNVVRAKYIASIILTIILGIISVLISIMISYIKTNAINIEQTIESLMETILSAILIISFLYPVVFKFGSTNGRIILFGIVFGIAGIIGLIASFIDLTFMINILENYSYIAIPVISILLLVVSYFISSKVYQNKEF